MSMLPSSPSLLLSSLLILISDLSHYLVCLCSTIDNLDYFAAATGKSSDATIEADVPLPAQMQVKLYKKARHLMKLSKMRSLMVPMLLLKLNYLKTPISQLERVVQSPRGIIANRLHLLQSAPVMLAGWINIHHGWSKSQDLQIHLCALVPKVLEFQFW